MATSGIITALRFKFFLWQFVCFTTYAAAIVSSENRKKEKLRYPKYTDCTQLSFSTPNKKSLGLVAFIYYEFLHKVLHKVSNKVGT